MADVAKKLLVKPGDRVLLVNGPPEAAALLGPLPAGATMAAGSGGTAAASLSDPGDTVIALVFAVDEAAFNAAVPTVRSLARTVRAAWVAYPKRSSRPAGTLSRDSIRAILEETTDVTPVTQVALDSVWSALRVRPKEAVGH